MKLLFLILIWTLSHTVHAGCDRDFFIKGDKARKLFEEQSKQPKQTLRSYACSKKMKKHSKVPGVTFANYSCRLKGGYMLADCIKAGIVIPLIGTK